MSARHGWGEQIDTTYQLIREQQNRLERKLPVAKVEQILQTGTQQIQDHGVVVAFRAEPTHKGDSNTTSKRLVDSGLVLQLRVLGLDRLELDGDLFTRNDVGAYSNGSAAAGRHAARGTTKVNVTETTASDLATNSVLVADPQILQNFS